MNDFWAQAVMVMGLVVLAYYFVTLAVNLAVLWASLGLLGRKMRVASARLDLPEERAQAVSVLVPAFNEEVTILDTVHALLRQDYPLFEVIVVNDGSLDGTLDLLRQEFRLQPLDPAGEGPLPCGQVRGLFISESCRNLIVVDKENGGKADALNAGLNAARYPLVCCVDADGLLAPDALKKLACQFARDDRVVAAGGVVRPLNGCQVQNGAVTKAGVPASLTGRVQAVEYLRAFLSGRFGWEWGSGLLIVSGAFGMFRRDVLLEAGGYADSLGEDMELTLRLHHRLLDEKRPYRVITAVDALCWTQVPETLRGLRTQRVRWHRGLAQALWLHRGMVLRPRYGAVGMAALPVFWTIELLGPVVELIGYGMLAALLLLGGPTTAALLVFAMAYLHGLTQSLTALVTEGRVYPSPDDPLRLAGACLLEPLLYRPLLALWRCEALVTMGRRARWGSISRKRLS